MDSKTDANDKQVVAQDQAALSANDGVKSAASYADAYALSTITKTNIALAFLNAAKAKLQSDIAVNAANTIVSKQQFQLFTL